MFFATRPAGYPKVSLEEVLARNPEVIVDMGDMSDAVDVTAEHKRDVVALVAIAPLLAAVKQRRVFAGGIGYFRGAGPARRGGGAGVPRMLHPKLTRIRRDELSRRFAGLRLRAATTRPSNCPRRGLVAIAGPERRGEIDAARDSRRASPSVSRVCAYREHRNVRRWKPPRVCAQRRVPAAIDRESNSRSPPKKWCSWAERPTPTAGWNRRPTRTRSQQP